MLPTNPIRIDRAPLRREIEKRLRSAILDGVFRPGDRLVERELIDQLGVSRPSLREAMRQLQAEELICGGPSGTQVVARVSPADAEHIYEVRALLEALAARRFAAQAPDGEVQALRRAFNDFKELARGKAKGNAALLRAKTAFYQVLLRGCGNPVVERMLTLLHNRVSLLRATSMAREGRLKETVAEVERIVVAIEKHDSDLAWTTTFEHVRNAATAALEVMRKREEGNGNP